MSPKGVSSRDVSVTTTKQACNDMFMSDSALVSCSNSAIINLSLLISLCELDYDASPVNL